MRQGKTDWGKAFIVKAITREDIFSAGFPHWQVAGLSDSQMHHIATQMGVSYTDSFFAEDLVTATTSVLCQPTRTNIIGEPI
jgi:hypothetical protein